jgi:DNA polymerase-3 subunit beta
MEFSAQKTHLLRELDLVQGVVEKKATIPILSNLLLEAQGGEVRISATDLELGVRCGCPAKVKKEGSGTVPARRLLDIVRSLPEADVKLKVLENHWVQVTCERSSFKLVGMAKDNFPVLPAFPRSQALISSEVLGTVIDRTIFAISNEETRYTLNGALLLLKPEIVSMVATDGHRLALVEREAAVGNLSGELRVLIPKKAMSELRRLVTEGGENANVEFAQDDSHLFFSVASQESGDEKPAKPGARLLIARKLTGQFPNYEAVLPRENNRVAELDRDLLASAIRRVALLADERSRAIRVQLDKDKVEIFSSSGEYGEANEILDAAYAGEPLQIGFNYQYLLDFLGVADGGGKVRLELKDDQSAGQLRPGEDAPYRYRYVVMPMRI